MSLLIRPAETERTLPWGRILGWTLFAAAFGYTEAALVVYLRRLLGMPVGMDYRQFYVLHQVPFTSAGIAAEMASQGILRLEQTREIATLLLLAGVAWGGGRTLRERGAVFCYTFAVWDLTYYLFLIPWTGFPQSFSTWDIYFLLPIASYGPVWFPVLVVMPVLVALALRLWRGRSDKSDAPVRVVKDERERH